MRKNVTAVGTGMEPCSAFAQQDHTQTIEISPHYRGRLLLLQMSWAAAELKLRIRWGSKQI